MSNRIAIADLLYQLEGEGTEKVKLAVTDIDGVLRGKVISFEKLKGIVEKGFGFCDVVFGWDAGDHAYDNGAFTGWHTGYPDALAVVDADTFRRVPWAGGLPGGRGGGGGGGGWGVGGRVREGRLVRRCRFVRGGF